MTYAKIYNKYGGYETAEKTLKIFFRNKIKKSGYVTARTRF